MTTSCCYKHFSSPDNTPYRLASSSRAPNNTQFEQPWGHRTRAVSGRSSPRRRQSGLRTRRPLLTSRPWMYHQLEYAALRPELVSINEAIKKRELEDVIVRRKVPERRKEDDLGTWIICVVPDRAWSLAFAWRCSRPSRPDGRESRDGRIILNQPRHSARLPKPHPRPE